MSDLRADAAAIWRAGVEAVRPQRLFPDKLRYTDGSLVIDEANYVLDLRPFRRIVVVGAGKAAAAMAEALDRTLLAPLRLQHPDLQVTGWLNCPEGTISCEIPNIHLCAARPAGVNAPTEKVISGTRKILDLVSRCSSKDLIICLISGGGSALLSAPTPPLTLGDKQAVAKLVAAAGGSIEQLNSIRTCLSDVKGGGLARACTGGHLLTIVISDVLGDPLEVIASGPTCQELKQQPREALSALQQLGLTDHPDLASVVDFLRQQHSTGSSGHQSQQALEVHNVILGNNCDAVDAAGIKAVELGYRYVMQSAQNSEGDVLEVAQVAAQAIEQLSGTSEIDCWISGGEPTVTLPSGACGKGGRNQQLALSVLDKTKHLLTKTEDCVFYSGGTDGEDGPTDAAGAWFDADIIQQASALNLSPTEYLANADAYHFFEATNSLILTGPTGTNVCDLRVALTAKRRN